MGLRLFATLAIFAATPPALARDKAPRVVGVVHSGGICWDPDVEFPVPCDEDED